MLYYDLISGFDSPFYLEMNVPRPRVRELFDRNSKAKNHRYFDTIKINLSPTGYFPEEVASYECKLVRSNGSRKALIELHFYDVEMPETKYAGLVVTLRLTMRDGQIQAKLLQADVNCENGGKRTMLTKELLQSPILPVIENVRDVIVNEDRFIQPFLQGDWTPGQMRRTPSYPSIS